MIKFKNFMNDLNEAVDKFPYKIPFELGAGWEKPTIVGDRWVFKGKGKYKGLVARQVTEDRFKKSSTPENFGNSWVPTLIIENTSNPPRAVGVVKAPKLVKGKAKGDWLVFGYRGTEDEMHRYETSMHQIGSELKMNAAIAKIATIASNMFGADYGVASKGGRALSKDEKDAANIVSKIKSFLGGGRVLAKEELYGKQITGVDIRYWGTWKLPADAYDEEDYDWEVLSKESAMKLNKFVASLNASNKLYDIQWSTGEKNWITITVSRK